MGWETKLAAGHKDRADLFANDFRRLPGFAKGPVKVTMSVEPGTIDAGETASVAVTLSGSGLAVSKWHKCVAVAPGDLEAGLVFLTSTITDAEEVTLAIENRTEAPIEAAARDWDFYCFTATGT